MRVGRYSAPQTLKLKKKNSGLGAARNNSAPNADWALQRASPYLKPNKISVLGAVLKESA